jgi:hypothetical protein
MTMKNAVFWDVAPCTVNVCSSRILVTLKMVATRSSETSVLTRPTRHHIAEDSIFFGIFLRVFFWSVHQLHSVY